MLKNLLNIGIFLATSSLIAIQQFDISGFNIICKTGQEARLVGDFPIQNPLQFQYTTQDNHSCLITQLEAKPHTTEGSKAVILTFEERYKRDPLTRKTIVQNPTDLGIPGNYQFMYTTRGPKGEILYGFVDYGNNETLKNLLEAIKLSRHAMNMDEQKQLQIRAPATFKTLEGFGGKLSE